MPPVSARAHRAQSPDLLTNHVLSKSVLATEALHYTTDAPTWQPCWDSEAKDPPSIPDIDDLEDEEKIVVESPFIPEDQQTLSSRYAVMVDSRSETPLYDRYTDVNTDKYETELSRVLREAFALHEHTLTNSNELMQQIAFNSNYSVETVTRVMNKQHYKMQQSFAENYNISATRTVYHGTSQAGAKSIETVGFKGSAGRRAKFGKGIYSSPVVWEALGYSKPYHDARQVFFVVEMLQGPTALGSEDQLDFGVDSTGKEILTLKNPEETVLCASKENQMLATYRVTMRYMFERPFLLHHRECVRVVHPDIALLIKHSRANATAAAATAVPPIPLPAAAAAALATASSVALKLRLQYVASVQNAVPLVSPSPSLPPGYVHVDFHSWFKVGQKVNIKHTLKAYREFVGKPGIISRIVKAPRYFFCVRLDDAALRTTVQRLNALPENKARFPFLMTNENDLVVLKVDQLDRYMTREEEEVAKNKKLLGKRKAQAST